MKYRRWDAKTKTKIILESLEHKMPLAELCNKYQIRQSLYYYWLNEFQTKAHKAFESGHKNKKEQKLKEEIKKLKRDLEANNEKLEGWVATMTKLN